MRSFGFSVRFATFGLLLAGWAAAAAPPAKVERVTVKKADNSTVAGELIAADHDGVVVKPAGKTDAVLVAWRDVASVSNGLTRGRAVAEWKAKRQGQLCDTCQGDRAVRHEACGGTGVDPATKQACAACKGTGSAGKCTNPKDKDGKTDCPGPCLKLSVGKWTVRDGTRVREYKFRSGGGTGSGYVSEAHLGEVWVFGPGGPAENKGPCAVCGGKALVDCGTCDGKGRLPCKPCRGTGATGPACKGCPDGRLKCADCKGTGLRPVPAN